MLHIIDGESVAGTLREAAIPGNVSVYGDLRYEGPAPAGLEAEAWPGTRARFMAETGVATLEEAQRYLRAWRYTRSLLPARGSRHSARPSAIRSADPYQSARLVQPSESWRSKTESHLRGAFPSADGGLSRTERQALSVLREHGSLAGRRLFAAVQRLEERIFMGDFNVIDGRADYIELNGISAWRWDGGRLVAC